jgi:aminoglycoside 2''-phosphotransferase
VTIAAKYLDRIYQILPEAQQATTIRSNLDGMVNDVVVVNEEWVFRFPKTEQGKQALAYESQLLQLIRQYVDLPVPDFTWHGEECVVYRFIPGVPLDRNTFLRQAREGQARLAEQLGLFLRQLHTIPQAELTRLALAAPPRRTPADWQAQFEEIERELYPFLWADQKHWVRELFAPVLDGTLDLHYEPALIHDDLASYHILYDPAAQRINGVIDFGVARLGDPADDFGILISGLPPSLLRSIGHAFGRAKSNFGGSCGAYRLKISVGLWCMLGGRAMSAH